MSSTFGGTQSTTLPVAGGWTIPSTTVESEVKDNVVIAKENIVQQGVVCGTRA